MNNEHLKMEMQNAVDVGDLRRAEALQAAIETPEVKGAEIDFVPASKAAQEFYGFRSCLIIHQLPANILDGKSSIYDYGDYLVRMARNEQALVFNEREDKNYILVQFPGRGEEEYSKEAFHKSLEGLMKK